MPPYLGKTKKYRKTLQLNSAAETSALQLTIEKEIDNIKKHQLNGNDNYFGNKLKHLEKILEKL